MSEKLMQIEESLLRELITELEEAADYYGEGAFPVSSHIISQAKNRIDSPATQWQPIETAPIQERRAILVYTPKNFCIFCVYWDSGVWSHFGTQSSQMMHVPTHWMPLPKPPTE